MGTDGIEMRDASLTVKSRSEQPTTIIVRAPTGTRPQEAPASTAQQPEIGIDFSDLLARIWKRKLVFVGFVAVAMALCAALLSQITPVYTARGLVLVGAPPVHIVDLQAVLAGVSAEADAVESEKEVLHSSALASAVVDGLSLDRYPEFNPALRPESTWTEARSIVRSLVGQLPLIGEADVQSPNEKTMDGGTDIGVVLNVMKNLSVSGRERSRLIDIEFSSEDPILAAEIVNTFLDRYITDQVEEKYKATIGAFEWLNRNVTSWQERTSESEKRIEDFRSQANLLEGEKGLLLLRQISETNAELAAAQLARSVAEARLREIEKIGPAVTLIGANEILKSPAIQGLREREVQLMAMEAEMLAAYGRHHPRVVTVQTELQMLRDAIAAEIDRVIDGLKTEIAANRSVEEMLSEKLAQLKLEVASANMAQVDLQALRREADANRLILDVFMSRLAETRGQADRAVLQPDSSVVTRAVVPLVPSYPKPMLFFALSFVLAIVASLLYIVLKEWLRTGFVSGDEIERVLSIPVLGLLPRLRGRGMLQRVSRSRRSAVSLPPALFGHRLRAYDRSVRWLGTSLSILQDNPRSILLTSARTAEGKTTAAVSLARVLAQVNGRVVVVDADLCRPRIHEAFKAPMSPGLHEVLLGDVSLEAALHQDTESGVYTLPAGTVNRQSYDSLRWPDLEHLIASLKESFDLIVIDGPPILQAPEARVLSRIADATILVVRWCKTDRRIVAAGIEQIEQAGGRPAGVLLSMVEPNSYARYSHSDSHRLLFDAAR